jgi:nucleoside-diphosphate-sugar epimerase
MASPFPASNPRDETEVIEPAVEGTINVLRACSKANIKRVVLTSSIASVVGKHTFTLCDNYVSFM